jgi:hypothetical protein
MNTDKTSFENVTHTSCLYVTKCGNPWLKIKCEECNKQILSYRNLGLASFFHKDDENPWRTGMATSLIRYICGGCSNKLGYDDGY